MLKKSVCVWILCKFPGTVSPTGLRLCLSAMALLILLTIGCGGESTSKNAASSDEKSDGTKTETTVQAEDEADESKEQDEDGKNDEKKKQRRERTTSIQAARVIRSDLVVPIIAEGTVRARHNAELRTEIEGRLLHLHAREGQSVRKGYLIAKLDGREYEVAAEEARAAYLRALSQLAVEEDSLDIPETLSTIREKMKELEALEKKGLISSEERMAREIALDLEALKEGDYRVEIVAARSGVSAARTSLERARLNLERTEIRAPFDGVVTGLSLSEGELLTKGQLVCALINNVDIEAEVGVLEADLGKFTVNRPALLVLPALQDTLQVKVDVISPQFDRASRTCQVLMRFRSEEGRIRPGMFVRAIIAGQTFEDRLLVPNEAILTRDNRPLLFKVEDDRSKWLYLDIGERNDHLVEVKRVLQGGTLSPGDLVVVSDHLTLAHDAKIKVKKIITPKDPWSSVQKDN